MLLLLLGLLLVPGLQSRFHFSPEGGLYGAFADAPHPDLTWEGLCNSTYQPALERYVEDKIGFRSFFIQLRNQLSFSLLRVARSSDIVVGQHDVLFQPGPIETYAGRDLLPEAEVRYRTRRLRAVQEYLARQGTTLLLVLAPNKARYEPEALPDYLRPAPGAPTTYARYAQALHDDSIHVLDFVPAFERWKHQYAYPLFPQGGTHWSGFGATLAGDSLIRRLEQLGHLRLPTVRTVGPPHVVHRSDSLRFTDNDIGEPLNLLWRTETTPLAYRRLAFDPPIPGQTRPSVLLVGDSFVWGLMQFGPYIQREFADNTRFWYYNKQVFQPDTVGHPTGEEVSSLDLRQQLAGRRFVIILLTEHNLNSGEFGFTNQLYHLFNPFTKADEAAIDQLTAKLTQEASWAEQSKEGFADRMRAQAQEQYEQLH